MPKQATITARERELYRYFQPEETNSASDEKKAATDPCLTAFAQLGALRLNTKRGIISLTTGTIEFIIAESGQALSLQREDDADDRLWHGVGAFKCPSNTHTTVGSENVNHFCRTGDQYLVVNDTTKDDRYNNKCIVTQKPYIRFMAAVPLITRPDSDHPSMIIGNYIAVDDKPREAGLTESEIQFMTDMAVTVMDYLEAGLIKRRQFRAERMIKAMSLFIEGKSTLRDWWLDYGHRFQDSIVHQKRAKTVVDLKHLADAEFGVQEPPVNLSKGLHYWPGHDDIPSQTPSSSAPSRADHDFGDGRPMLPREESHTTASDTNGHTTLVSKSWKDRDSSVTTFDTLTGPATEHTENRHSVSFDLPPHQVSNDVSKELQDALLSTDLKRVFSRASNLIREAIGVEGVVFFDASVGSFGGSADKNVMEEKAPGAFQTDKLHTSSEDESGRKQSVDLDISAASASDSAQHTEATEKYCSVLGFSSRYRSSLLGHQIPEGKVQLPESMLRRLLKRYPHGKIFNFDGDGVYSSGDSDQQSGRDSEPNSTLHPSSQDTKARRNRLSKEAEAKAILKVLPNARSVFWFPLWDNSRERWFAGTLVSSTSPTRSLCPYEDLTYLAAFGNSAMAEVARLSAQVLDKMKSDFISSISHELRSPLHGVLASVEFLQETSMTEDQEDMVNNIHASGKVLLDTINHVLDFSKVNRKAKNKSRITKFAGKRRKKQFKEHAIDDDAEDTADMCVLSEEVIESIHAGHSISRSVLAPSSKHKRNFSINSNNLPLTIITDIAWHPNWTFEMDPGAWSRILMNLFSNAMKYTKSGFIKVSLEVEKEPLSRGKRARPILTLKVKDSGKGISKEFLKHRLYKPFTQEDSLATGAGLGLSIVRHIIQDLGGSIDFVSEQGSGTEATVRIPLTEMSTPTKSDGPNYVAEARVATKGLRYSLESFDKYPDIAEEPTGILSAEVEGAMLLKSSVQTLMSEWFDMELSTTAAAETSPDVVVIMESGMGERSVKDILQSYTCDRPTKSGKSVAIVLCSTYHPGPKMHSCGAFQIFYHQQPAFVQHTGPIPESELDGHKVSPPTAGTSYFPPTHTAILTPHPTETPINGSAPAKELESQSIPDASTKPLDSGKENIPPTTAVPVVIQPKDLRVLLVEDNEINLKLLIATMRKLGITHSTATNGLEALNTYKNSRGAFDVIFMDISMPIMSGIDSTRHIRRFERDEGLEPTRLIALTGAANPNTRQEAFSSGVDLFLTKPVPMRELRGMLEDLRREATRILEETDVLNGEVEGVK
ncbi:Autoinducer 2 sensor kinase/phosphatase [Lachnellula hyalina]|uniref:histidine kinase n=1 Tax=Lachnellula hyalina TaxID=1316788 RepID=A0A8H8TV67_9HELO|nr:Autoinducer 2 sensor kinase/phosphatase [Lachnellula hyalina]TVY23559.1 Autoinducer 2 sensor kinase/phosphatase [Lachnellula hyalina]